MIFRRVCSPVLGLLCSASISISLSVHPHRMEFSMEHPGTSQAWVFSSCAVHCFVSKPRVRSQTARKIIRLGICFSEISPTLLFEFRSQRLGRTPTRIGASATSGEVNFASAETVIVSTKVPIDRNEGGLLPRAGGANTVVRRTQNSTTATG